jgi:putative copper export protein
VTPLAAPRGVAVAGSAALALSALLLYVDQVLGVTATDPRTAAQGIAGSRQGLLLATRVIAAALVALATAGAFARTRTAAALLVVGAGLGVLAVTLVSHAAASGELVQTAIDALHVLAMGAWSGGLVALVATIARSRPQRDVGVLVSRFSLLALASVSLLILTGVLAGLRRLRLVDDLYETPYGLAVLVKVALLALAVVLGARNLLVHGPLLRRSGAATARRHLIRNSGLEVALVAGILASTAVLTALVPPAQAATAPFDEVRRLEGTRIGLRLAATSPGRNRFEVTVADGIRPATDIVRVVLRFTMLTMDMGESELLATQRAPGRFIAEGSPLSMYGPWRAEVIVRRSDRADLRTAFTVPVVPPASGATARVVVAAPYTLVAFTDPAEPTAGAPFAISVVVADSVGIAVSDASVRARIEGAERTELGPVRADAGRYALPVAGLSAGRYRVTLVIDRAGQVTQAQFEFEVAR